MFEKEEIHENVVQNAMVLRKESVQSTHFKP